MASTTSKTKAPTLRLGPGDQLQGRRGTRGTWIDITPRPVFPLTDVSVMISLRASDGKEWAFVEDPADLESESEKALVDAVSASRFHIQITKVHEIELQHELRLWKVSTQQGERTFPAKLDHWPRPLGERGEEGWLVTDVCGDVYQIPPEAELDEKSRKILWSFIG